MAAHDYLTNQFLIAMPAMNDPNFAQTVTFICEHNQDGALGIIINRPLKMKLGDVFEQLKLTSEDPVLRKLPVLQGGPVQQDRGFVIHKAIGSWDSTVKVSNQIHVTTSPDILDALARGSGPDTIVLALGYAGWQAGQLEAEIVQNAWLTTPADDRVLFDTPFEQRWHAAGRLLGVDLATISPVAGHA
jgi:putative transcriptional regulator